MGSDSEAATCGACSNNCNCFGHDASNCLECPREKAVIAGREGYHQMSPYSHKYSYSFARQLLFELWLCSDAFHAPSLTATHIVNLGTCVHAKLQLKQQLTYKGVEAFAVRWRSLGPICRVFRASLGRPRPHTPSLEGERFLWSAICSKSKQVGKRNLLNDIFTHYDHPRLGECKIWATI